MWGVGYKLACIVLGIVGWIVTPPVFVFVGIMALANAAWAVVAVAAIYGWLAYRAVRRFRSPSAWSFIEPTILGAIGVVTRAAAILYAQAPRQHWY